MVACQDEVVLRLVLREVPRRLPHGVGRSLEPVRIVRRLFGRENLDEIPLRTYRAGRWPRCAG